MELRAMPAVNDDAAWDLEAYKLLLLDRELVKAYQGGAYTGWWGLVLLHLADIPMDGVSSVDMEVSTDNEKSIRQLTPCAIALVDACRRINIAAD